MQYKPQREKDKQRPYKFGEKVLDALFVGYDQHAGGGWSGDLLRVDAEELDEADTLNAVNIKGIDAKEVLVTQVAGKFNFPLAEGVLILATMRPACNASGESGPAEDVVPKHSPRRYGGQPG